jgi:type VI protein secretion system component Hcp
MARIKISDIEKNRLITREEMKQVTGGTTTSSIAPISLVKTFDAATPALLTEAISREQLSEVTFNFYHPDSDDDEGE